MRTVRRRWPPAALLLAAVCSLLPAACRAGWPCFAAGSSVRSGDGRTMRMEHAVVGDKLLAYNEATGGAEYSPVISWLHYEPHTDATFMHIRTYKGRTLLLTPGHIVFRIPLCRRNTHPEKVPARSLQYGDCMLTVVHNGTSGDIEQCDRLVHIDSVTQTGIYAPMTQLGTVIVQEVVASCSVEEQHSTLVNWAVGINQWLTDIVHFGNKASTENDDNVVPLSLVYKALLALRDWVSLDYTPLANSPQLL